MSRLFFIAAIILFFFEGVGVHIIPHPTTWGLFAMALGLALGGVSLPGPWRKNAG